MVHFDHILITFDHIDQPTIRSVSSIYSDTRIIYGCGVECSAGRGNKRTHREYTEKIPRKLKSGKVVKVSTLTISRKTTQVVVSTILSGVRVSRLSI